jgi:ribosomal protein S10
MKKNVPVIRMSPSKRGWEVWFNDRLHKRFLTIEEAGKETVSISGAIKLISDLMSPEENKRN